MAYEFKINCEIDNIKYKKGQIVPEWIPFFPNTMKRHEEVKEEAQKTDTESNTTPKQGRWRSTWKTEDKIPDNTSEEVNPENENPENPDVTDPDPSKDDESKSEAQKTDNKAVKTK